MGSFPDMYNDPFKKYHITLEKVHSECIYHESCIWGHYGYFPFNKNSGLKFRKFNLPNGAVHSGCTDPTQATARLVIVLVSRIQKSGTVKNNLVKWKGTFRSDRPR